MCEEEEKTQALDKTLIGETIKRRERRLSDPPHGISTQARSLSRKPTLEEASRALQTLVAAGENAK